MFLGPSSPRASAAIKRKPFAQLNNPGGAKCVWRFWKKVMLLAFALS
jgi:hypothetical protein